MANDERAKPERIFNIRKAAEMAGLSQEMMRHLVRRGDIAAEKPEGSTHYIIREHALNEWFDKRSAMKKRAQAS